MLNNLLQLCLHNYFVLLLEKLGQGVTVVIMLFSWEIAYALFKEKKHGSLIL